MTVIAFDGKTLAADKQATNCGMRHKTTKIFRMPDGSLAACCGSEYLAREIMLWIGSGLRDSKEFPAPRDKEHWATVSIFRRGEPVMTYQNGPLPEATEDAIYAAGSGRDYAIAAMHLGKSAREAVEVASVFDTGCGMGIDELALDP